MRLLLLLAACSSTTTPPSKPSGDPAEPAQPAIECQVEAQPVHCEPGLPTRTALQPSPFEWCAREHPATRQGTGRLFSPRATRAARARDPQLCCYLEWTWTACR